MHNASETALRGQGLRLWIGLLLLGFAATTAQAQQAGEFNICGDLGNHYGPYDYRTEKNKLIIVNNAHFTPVVESLIGSATGDMNADIDYVLRASPNHHRALVSVMRLAARTKDTHPKSFKWSLACYFDRAVRFAPDDGVARMLYAQFLGQAKRVEDATRQLDIAIKLAPENALSQYNAGLVFLEMGQFDRALAQAHVAQKMGFTRTDLTDSLKKANRWQEPQ